MMSSDSTITSCISNINENLAQPSESDAHSASPTIFNFFSSSPISPTSTPPSKPKSKVLCLHGFRTSGDILEMQMACLRHNIPTAEFHFINGPLPATGPPDPLVAHFFANMNYFEWFEEMFPLGHVGLFKDERDDGSINIDNLDISTKLVLNHIAKNGPYDGILGFSQGARLAAHIVCIFQNNPDLKVYFQPPKFVISICGVVAMKDQPLVSLPTYTCYTII